MKKYIYILFLFFVSLSYGQNPTIVEGTGNLTNKNGRTTGKVLLDLIKDPVIDSLTLNGDKRTAWPTGGGGGTTGIFYSATLNFTNLAVIGATQDEIMATPGTVVGASAIVPLWPTTLPTDSDFKVFVPSNNFTVVRRTAWNLCNGYTNTFTVIITSTNSIAGLNPANATLLGNLNFNGYKATGMANGVNPTDAATVGQIGRDCVSLLNISNQVVAGGAEVEINFQATNVNAGATSMFPEVTNNAIRFTSAGTYKLGVRVYGHVTSGSLTNLYVYVWINGARLRTVSLSGNAISAQDGISSGSCLENLNSNDYFQGYLRMAGAGSIYGTNGGGSDAFCTIEAERNK